MTKEAFYKLPKWKQNKLKMALQLFWIPKICMFFFLSLSFFNVFLGVQCMTNNTKVLYMLQWRRVDLFFSCSSERLRAWGAFLAGCFCSQEAGLRLIWELECKFQLTLILYFLFLYSFCFFNACVFAFLVDFFFKFQLFDYWFGSLNGVIYTLYYIGRVCGSRQFLGCIVLRGWSSVQDRRIECKNLSS